MDLWDRNSAIVATHGAVSSDQPRATSIGIDILKLGGNAADAAVAAMAAVSVIQPMTCGIGGDCQCLFYRSTDKTLLSINGSGRTGENATIEKVKATGVKDSTEKEFSSHGFWVSVPGTVAGMFSAIKHFGSGKLTMSQILDPVIKLAEEGVPMPYKTSIMWEKYKEVFEHSRNSKDVLNGDRPPAAGEIYSVPKLANSLKSIAVSGAEAFYCGEIAHHIAEEVIKAGGELTLNDMKDHLKLSSISEPSEALYVDFHGFRVWEMKPSTIGIVALVALNVLKLYDLKALGHNSAEYIHILAEATKYAYLESWEYLCDPSYCSKHLNYLLSDENAEKIKNKINSKRASESNLVFPGGNTSYVASVDGEGNGCSFICSVSSNFGTGLIPDDCGFVLHDRAKSMNFEEDSPNAYGPRKFPMHSIIPSMITDSTTNNLLAVFGVIGRWMQPQGHIQVLLNMVIFGMDPQNALHQPRFFVGNPKTLMEYKNSLSLIFLEEGVSQSVVPFLQNKGHDVVEYYSGCKREIFGKGHIIAHPALWNKHCVFGRESWWAGADPRSDGCSMGY